MPNFDSDRLSVRPFSPDQDIPGLLAFYADVEAVDRTGDEVNEQLLRDQLALPGHDPLHDRWVVEATPESPSLIASGLVRVPPSTHLAVANIIVHPARRGHGIGTALLSKIASRARQLDADAIEIYVNSKLPASVSFLQKRSFTAQGAYTELRLTKNAHLPPVIWPYGYTVRPYFEVQDISILTEAMNLCYIPLWGHHEACIDDMASWLSNFNQHGLFLAFSEKGRVIGITRTEPSLERSDKNGIPTGYIDAPGVVPQHRRLDLYRALVLTGIHWLHEQGQVIVEMESWGDKLEVLKMYRELGFKDVCQQVCYRMDLHAGDHQE